MVWKYSDGLASFKGDPDEDADAKTKPGFDRFAPWVQQGFKKGKGPQGRPLMRVVALLIIIVALAWSSTRPNGLKRVLIGGGHSRVDLPLGIGVGVAPAWTEENVRAAVSGVRPKALACLNGWPELVTNDDGKVVVEVVLTPDGPDGATLFDQVAPVPSPIATCLGGVIGSAPWPLPADTQSVPFPIN